MTDLNRKSHDLFIEAIQIPPSEWPSFLDENCDSQELRERVKALLDAHVGSGDFLAETAMETYPKLTMPFGGQVEEFKIMRLIGKGGMGRVYLAEDTVLKRLIALKVISHEDTSGTTNDEVVARFRREARAAARLVHPGVVQVYRTGEKEGLSYIAMEYVEGTNLREKLRSESGMPLAGSGDRFRNVAILMAQIADAIDHAHRAGVIHRDVKPSNILIDEEGKARLADFGVARIITEETLMGTGAIVGSCAYMSPEQARVSNVDVDHRSDIFSLGVVLYEAASLQRPFKGENFNDLMKALSDCNPKPLKRVVPKIPKDLSVICHKAIEKDVLDRYQSAAHFYADLRCFVEGKPILARPPSLGRRIRNGLKKHQRLVVAALILFLATSLVAVMAAMNSMRKSQMGQLRISEQHRGATVTARRYADDPTIEETIDLGKAPLSTYLKPGLYRVVIEDADTTLEASSLLDAGTEDFVEVNVPSEELINSLVGIPGGQYELGSEKFNFPLRAYRTKKISTFQISPTEVSNREYREFLNATDLPPPRMWPKPYDREIDDLPVMGITWDEANLYCRWKGVRLPTPDEWEAASKGPEKSKFPWGENLSNEIRRQETSELGFDSYREFAQPVESAPKLATPLGVFHMLSNVQEYTEGIAAGGERGLVIKGRSWADSPFIEPSHLFTLSAREGIAINRGFRISLSINNER